MMSLKIEIEKISTKFFGDSVIINDFLPVGGGSINETFKLNTNAGSFFIKKNSASLYPQMFQKEVQGLKILSGTGAVATPMVIGLCVVRVFETINFQIYCNFHYFYNHSIYDKPRITYEPLLWAFFL